MHKSSIALILIVAPIAQLAFPQPGGPPRLPQRELVVISALLLREARHPEKPRPILVLTPTEPWMPQDPKIERPPDFPEDQWQLQRVGPLSMGLRNANHEAYDLAGVHLPPGVALFPRDEFERAYKSDVSFRKLVQSLGGVEPLVLKVSRPSFDEDHRASILLHELATWSGCGGVDEYYVDDSSDPPAIELRRVLVIW